LELRATGSLGRQRHGNGQHRLLEILEHQKRLTANQWKIAGAARLGDMLDFFDFFQIGFVLAFIVKEWSLT
jgi:putative MFS transporter